MTAAPSAPAPSPRPSETEPARLASDDASWDEFVASAPHGSYLQLAAWARVKRRTGWRSMRATVGGPSGTVGAQVLLHKAGPLPWTVAYAPRGPVIREWTPEAVAVATDELRRAVPAAAGRLTHIRIDPDLEVDADEDAGGRIRAALHGAGWRPTAPVQQNDTWLVDLSADEAALWSDLRKKWRQYVNRARSAGVTVRESGPEGLEAFHRIIEDNGRRIGFIVREPSAYRAIWDELAPGGGVRLLFADGPDGVPVATLFLVRCGDRVTEPFGGMLESGGELRANYLLKWESLRRSRAWGARRYDMWGLVNPGITHFKSGFGGREVHYIGAWDLVIDPVGYAAFNAARKGRVWWARRRHGLPAEGSDRE